MRTPLNAGVSASLAALVVLGCAGGGGDGRLLDPSPGAVWYRLADVDGQALPVVLGVTYTFEHGEERLSVIEGELLLRQDSTAALASRLRISAPQWDTSYVVTADYRYAIEGDSLNWCPDVPAGSIGPCYRALYTGQEVVLRALFYGPPGGGRQYRFMQ